MPEGMFVVGVYVVGDNVDDIIGNVLGILSMGSMVPPRHWNNEGFTQTVVGLIAPLWGVIVVQTAVAFPLLHVGDAVGIDEVGERDGLRDGRVVDGDNDGTDVLGANDGASDGFTVDGDFDGLREGRAVVGDFVGVAEVGA